MQQGRELEKNTYQKMLDWRAFQPMRWSENGCQQPFRQPNTAHLPVHTAFQPKNQPMVSKLPYIESRNNR